MDYICGVIRSLPAPCSGALPLYPPDNIIMFPMTRFTMLSPLISFARPFYSGLPTPNKTLKSCKIKTNVSIIYFGRSAGKFGQPGYGPWKLGMIVCSPDTSSCGGSHRPGQW